LKLQPKLVSNNARAIINSSSPAPKTQDTRQGKKEELKKSYPKLIVVIHNGLIIMSAKTLSNSGN
jgi:hypothetical protein